MNPALNIQKTNKIVNENNLVAKYLVKVYNNLENQSILILNDGGITRFFSVFFLYNSKNYIQNS